MKTAPTKVIPPKKKNIPYGPNDLLWTMNSIVIAFSRRLAYRAKIARPKPVSVATSPAYIQAIGP